MPLIVLLNGPPGSGKDEAAKILEATGLHVSHKKFASKVKRDLVCMLDFPKTWNQMEVSAENWKDTPQAITGGYTPRDVGWWYVKMMTDKFGQDFFAKHLAREISGSPAKMIAVSDSGYKKETDTLVKQFGKDSILLVHLQRDGCTFENDDRSYIECDGVTTIEINNRHDKSMYRVQIINAVFKWAGWEIPEDCQ